MIDYEKIGRRIYEERKYIRHISQEKMAEDLGMYQADISNLEKAKKSSGITDLNKLQLIADYFSLPIENLLFGTSAEAHMVDYEGGKMELRMLERNKQKIKNAQHKKLLKKLMDTDPSKALTFTFECGPYTTYPMLDAVLNNEDKSFDEMAEEAGALFYGETGPDDDFEGEEEMAASEFYGCIKYLRSIIRNTDSTDPVEVAMDYGKDIDEMDLPSLASYEDDDEDYDDEE